MPLEEPPNRAAAAGDPALAHDRNDFIQRQIRLLGNQPQQNGRVRLQRRDAASARLGRNASRFVQALHPFDRRAGAHLDAFSCLASRRARFDLSQHTHTQVQ